MKLLMALAVLVSTAVFAQEGQEDPANSAGQGGKEAPEEQKEPEHLSKKGFSRSDCKGFFKHEDLTFKVEIDSFQATRTTINGPQDIVMLLTMKGSITDGKVKKVIDTTPTPSRLRAQSNSYAGHAQFYKTSLRNPFNFLKKYPDEDLGKAVKSVSVVAKKDLINFDRGGSFHYKEKRVQMQPVFMCITFDLTKVEKRKSSSTKKSHAFYLSEHVETLRKWFEPPPPKVEEI
ncbi:MAG: hypothetical protein F4W92_06290 [Gammaproteobacteria bacterium]|nr:hypothetical protein [Gammaproteobacteria bacterium]